MQAPVGLPPTPAPHAPAVTPTRAPWRWLNALVLLSVSSIFLTKISMPAAMLTLIGGLSLPPLVGRTRLLARAAITLAAITSMVGLGRFFFLEALPGMVAGGRAAIEKRAVSLIRGIVVAEDYSRRHALLDTDGDGIGAALSLGQLGGYDHVGPKFPTATPPLAFRKAQLLDTPRGPSLLEGAYLLAVCLPKVGGTFEYGRPASFDEERSETRYLVYAWPARKGDGEPTTVFFSDEHETILQLGLSATRPFVGTTSPPPCDAALTTADWQPWKNKKKRTELPGAN